MHVVREGDTLWDLASFYLSDPFLWPEIYRLNTIVVEDPHWIYPAEELLVPGREELGLPREPGQEVAARPPEPQVRGELKTIFTAPQLTRQTLTYQPLPPVPPMAVTEGDFYRAGLLLPLSELGPRGEIVDVTPPPGFPVEPLTTIPRFGRIYVSHVGGEPPGLGDRMLIYRVEREVIPWGNVIRPTGMATIAAVHEDVSTAVVTELFDRIMIGDKTMPAERFSFERGVFAEPVASGPSGQIVALFDEQWVGSTEDLVFIDVGRSQGVEVGDEFELYAAARRASAGHRLPEEHVGTGRVVRVTEETSTLRLVAMRHPTVDVGVPVRLVRKMPM
ncbi:MAG: LysM peptidoglycan-binding domain-containing protein [Gemmatimonadota bacterium]|nr:MAG: LysM peptidoglycan-binding domain-containing protein [Gemmatimonadota bacterium]